MTPVPLSKTQLDKLGDRLRAGSRDEADLRLLDEYRQSFLPAYETVWDALSFLRLEKLNARRLKTVYSIEEKLKRQRVRLTQIQDIAGVRLTCRDAPDQDLLLKMLSLSLFPNSDVDDRREKPSYGYRAVHIIVTDPTDRMVEIQIRTREQHRWAQVSEKMAEQFGSAVKYGGGPRWAQESLLDYSQTVKACEQLERQHHDLEHTAREIRERTSDAETGQGREKMIADANNLEIRVREQRAILQRELERMAALIEMATRKDPRKDDIPN